MNNDSLTFTELPRNINEAQWKAINHKGSHLLIVAGPGTGKTHTLTYRIAKIVQDLNSKKKILAITFTNKAALEMKERLNVRLEEKSDQVTIGTFHSFCLQTLQQYTKEARLPKNFHVATPQKLEELTANLWNNLNQKEKNDRLEEVSHYKSIEFDEEEPQCVKEYNDYLRKNECLDFDDLLLETIKLFESNPKIVQRVQKTYPFIFVDEYQDINPAQHVLLRKLVGEDVHITAIGDPNQAIYGFRGSDVELFHQFEEDFKPTTRLYLEENYRAASKLLDASIQVIQKSKHQMPELTAQILTEGHLKVYEAPTDKAEAEYVVHQIEQMVGGTSMFSQDSGRVGAEYLADRTFGDIAVLYRLNSQKNLLKEAFDRSGIPYEISGEKPLENRLIPKPDDKYVERSEKVSFLTLHAAKGLEFPIVFIVGCEDNLIPLKLDGFDTDKEEERRLFYVGMTRAQEFLYFVHAKKRFLYGKSYQNKISPFVHDIEEDLKAYEKAIAQRTKKVNPQMDLFG